jgi:hypothetical protein
VWSRTKGDYIGHLSFRSLPEEKASDLVTIIKAFLKLAMGGTLASGLPLKAVTLSAESGTASGH